MVSSCSNPVCRREVRYLNTGSLYAFERRSSATEFFWLCRECGPQVSLFLDATGSVSAKPRSNSGRPRPPHPNGDLRLVAGPAEGTPWHWSSLAGEPPYSNHARGPLSSSSDGRLGMQYPDTHPS